MAEPTLTEVFGAGATQSSTQLVIDKADLVAMGLTASAANTAESLLIALVKQWQINLTEQNRLVDLPARNVSVNYSGQDLVEQAGVNYRRSVWSILAYKNEPLETIDPDDY